MTKIADLANDLKYTSLQKETEVLKLSQLIASKIGINPTEVPNNFTYPLKRYRIVTTHRCFETGWIKLFEINPIKCKDQMGYINNDNAYWIDQEGTCTKNRPPKHEIEKFFIDLDAHLSSDTKTFFERLVDWMKRIFKTS